MERPRIPLWLKVAWTLWVAIWAPIYYHKYGSKNFLWFCDLGNFLIMAGLWAESAVVLSWQACSVLMVQILFTIDLVVRALFGVHPIGGTGYMFDDDGSHLSLGLRLLSLFHVVTPPVLIWCLSRTGYDGRGLAFQVATNAVVLPVCWLGWPETVNLNWVWGPFDRPQYVVRPPWLYLILCLLAYPVILSLPA
ncbi:MAG TPA: hypothetical protein VKW04_16220, partial [Planctomycetota bacterium]|nr:hypothetical protein [Planctomycetota bacterium]